VEVGKTTKLSATVAPADATNQTVAYKSSDEKIATIAGDGTVTGVAAGSATITATADGKSGTSAITVTAAE
jgi:alpha-L-fucosidase 2